MIQTPNVKKLIIYRVSVLAIPKGGGFADGIRFFSNPEQMKQQMNEAAKWVEGCILAIRQATGDNPWRTSSDEEIAGEILRLADNGAAEGFRKP